jgi:hypothetical protein
LSQKRHNQDCIPAACKKQVARAATAVQLAAVTLDGGQLSWREHRTHSNLFRYFTTLYHLLKLCAKKCDDVGPLRTLNLGRREGKPRRFCQGTAYANAGYEAKREE